MTQPFPPDLPGLLRIACSQGKLRLNIGFGARENGRGYQANLANSGNGWSIDYDPDPLEAITKVLRTRYGKMLERKCADATGGRYTGDPRQLDIEDAIARSCAGESSIEDLIG